MSFFWLPLLWASTFDPQPFSETVQSAPIVVRAEVQDGYSDWGINDSGVKQIFTYYKLHVTEVLRGTVNTKKITIREMGGEKDGVTVTIPGTSVYRPGEDVVVLLKEPTKEEAYPVRGMSTGKYIVVTQPDGTLSLQGESSEPWTLHDLRKLLKKNTLADKIASTPTPWNIPLEIPPPPPEEIAMPPAWTYFLALLGLILILVLVKR